MLSQTPGGLSIGHLKERNLALLGKWLWRFSNDEGNLWHSTILSKYDRHSNGWDANLKPSQTPSLLWKNIISIIPAYIPFTRFSMGNGVFIKF